MKAREIHSFAAVLLLVMLALPVHAVAPSFGALIEQADEARTSDPKAFDRILKRLDGMKDRASEADRRHLRFLKTYQRIIRGDYEAALGDASVLFDETTDPDLKFRIGLLVANTAAVNRDFGVGLRYLERSLALQHEVKNPDDRHYGYGVAAIIYNQYGQFQLGRHYAELLLSQTPNARNQCIGGAVRIESMHYLGELRNAHINVEKLISECVDHGEVIVANFARANLARHWAQTRQRLRSIGLLEAHIAEVEATRYPRLIGEVRSLLAEYLLAEGRIAEAQTHAAYVVALKGLDPYSQPMVEAYKTLHDIAVLKQDWRGALDSYTRYSETKSARIDDIKARELAFHMSTLEVKQKNQSIALLSKQNEVLKLEQQVARQSARITELIVALLVLGIAWAGIWILRAKRLQRSLRDLAETDGLTGLANRRHFRVRSEALLADCAQRNKPVSILLFDLDHFKQINDECGHAAGDWVLREVARVGRQHCRQGDLYGRIGGEEFAITLVDCDLDMAMRIAEECRRAIARINGAPGGCTLPVSASVGCVGSSTSGYSYEKLIAHADAAMYRSKVAGRNRVSLYEASLARRPAHAGREPTPHLVGG